MTMPKMTSGCKLVFFDAWGAGSALESYCRITLSTAIYSVHPSKPWYNYSFIISKLCLYIKIR